MCLLKRGATHSFLRPCVVSLVFAATSKGANFTIIVVNGNKTVCDNDVKTGLVFMVQGNKMQQVTTVVKLYVLDRLSTGLILGMNFLQWYTLLISWIDTFGASPCLVANGCACKSITNCVGSTQRVSHHAEVTEHSNGMLCND